MSKDVNVSVIGFDFEPALRWRKPAIDDATHDKPALTEPEGERLLFSAIAGVALHANRHVLTIPLKPVQSLICCLAQSAVRST